MEWLSYVFKLGLFWICLDAVIIAMIWFIVAVIRPLCPKWWQQVIIDKDPYPY